MSDNNVAIENIEKKKKKKVKKTEKANKDVGNKKTRRISLQNIFCSLSAGFLLACMIFYGGRFIRLYKEANKIIEAQSFATQIKNTYLNSEEFQNINGDYYFYGDVASNYVSYSNLLWRIVKINEQGETLLIADDNLTYLASGEVDEFKSSYIYEWLNNNDSEYTGILQKQLNNASEYLRSTAICLDVKDNKNNEVCSGNVLSSTMGLLSINDYINTGDSNSFINNGTYFYLSDYNNEKDIWYVSAEGKLSTNDGTGIYGVRPVITLASNLEILSGNGSKESPYVIEKEKGYFGSYVKLGEDLWRIYQVNDGSYGLVLTDYIMKDEEKFSYNYSSSTYSYVDTKSKSIAYYLNNDYLESLTYNNLILDSSYANGFYGTSQYDYKKVLETTVTSKVALLSIGDIILNSDLSEYFLMTGTNEIGTYAYTIKDDGKLGVKNVNSNSYVVPVITIAKGSLANGDGSIYNPYKGE